MSLILGIPLSPRSPPDRVVWAHSQSGLFTTSSAYKLLVASASASHAGSSVLEPQKKKKFGEEFDGCVYPIN